MFLIMDCVCKEQYPKIFLMWSNLLCYGRYGNSVSNW